MARASIRLAYPGAIWWEFRESAGPAGTVENPSNGEPFGLANAGIPPHQPPVGGTTSTSTARHEWS
jgi:hypothetical protein